MGAVDLYGPCPTCGVSVDPDLHDCPSWQPPPQRAVTARLWTMPDIATRLGVAHETVRSWLHRGQMPAPSGRVGQSPWWAPDVIEPWMEERAADAAREEE